MRHQRSCFRCSTACRVATYEHLQQLGATVPVIASLWVFGPAIRIFAAEDNVAVESLDDRPHHQWTPDECPLCQAGVPLESL
jgi:hypothetical protein